MLNCYVTQHEKYFFYNFLIWALEVPPDEESPKVYTIHCISQPAQIVEHPNWWRNEGRALIHLKILFGFWKLLVRTNSNQKDGNFDDWDVASPRFFSAFGLASLALCARLPMITETSTQFHYSRIGRNSIRFAILKVTTRAVVVSKAFRRRFGKWIFRVSGLVVDHSKHLCSNCNYVMEILRLIDLVYLYFKCCVLTVFHFL